MEANLTNLSTLAHRNAVNKGFYSDVELIEELIEKAIISPGEYDLLVSRAQGSRLALIASEVSEALEAVRGKHEHSEGEELADAIIRILDYAGWRGIDLDYEVRRKMAINAEREHMHGGKRL